MANKWHIPHWTSDLAETLEQPGLEAVILASPTQVHAEQAEEVMRAGKHVLIEIPIADSVADSERIVQVQKEAGVVAWLVTCDGSIRATSGSTTASRLAS